MMRVSTVLLGLVLACTGTSRSPEHANGSGAGSAGSSAGSGSAIDDGSATVIKQPGQKGGAFVQGAALTPADKLVGWLDGQKIGDEGKLLRVPLALAKTKYGFEIQGAKLGTAADALVVHVNDAALGISLEMRARKCKDEVCAFLVEGYWRGKQDGEYTFDVMKAGEPLAGDELAKLTHAEVEGESGN